jgi:TolA-binding protein
MNPTRSHHLSLAPGRVLRTLVLASLLLLAGGQAVRAQDSADTIERMRRVTELVQANKLVEARPDLLVLVKQATDKDRPKMAFTIALSYVYEYFQGSDEAVLNEAQAQFEKYLADYPDDELVPLARYNLADIYAAKGDYAAALGLYLPLYDYPPQRVDRMEILRKIARVYVAQKDWVGGMPYFRDTMRFSADATERTTAAAYLLIGQAKQGDIGDARGLLEFFKTPAPVFYTVRFNAALMEIGDQLYDEGQFATAGLFYQLVRSYETLEAGLSHYVGQLEAQAERLKGSIEYRSAYIETRAMLETARLELEALRNSTNYTPLLNWRIARLYLKLNRDWEAYWRFRVLAETYPDHPQHEHILYAAFTLARKLGENTSAAELARQYFKNKNYREFRGPVVNDLGDIYREQAQWDLFFALTGQYLADSNVDRTAEQLVFKHGLARLGRLENRQLIRDFEALSTQYGQSALADELHYFLGLACLLEQDYDRSIAEFEAVIADPNSPYAKDASFRKALAVMGQDRMEEARTLLRAFVQNYPDNPLRAEAEIALGDIENMFGNAEGAIVHYQIASEHAAHVALLAKAAEKIANIRWQQGKTQAAIEHLERFTAEYADSPEVIPAVAALAAFYEEAGEPRQALACIRACVERFAGEPGIPALGALLAKYLELDTRIRALSDRTRAFFTELRGDPVLLETLIKDRAAQYRYFKENPAIDPVVKASFVQDKAFRQQVLASPAALEELAARIRELDALIPVETAVDELQAWFEAATADADTVLAVRFEAALAQREDPPAAPSPERIALLDDPAIWPELDPQAKLWILREIARDTPERSVAALELMLPEYANTDAELDIHLQLADAYERLDIKDKALERYHSVVQRFSGKDVAGECALKEGQLLFDLGRYDEARQVLEGILARSEWRGDKHARALLMLGEIYTAQGQYAEAHGFYERIILGYPSFSEELALAFYKDIQVLGLLNETESVRTVYEAFLQTPGLEDTRGARLIRSEIQL